MSLSSRCVSVVVMLASALGASSIGAQTSDPVAVTRIALRKAKAQAEKQPRAPMIPRETFLRRQKIVDVRLSPDGRYISFLRRNDQGADAIVRDVASGSETRVAAGLQRVETAWSGDGRRLWIADDQGLVVVENAGLRAKRIYKWNPRRSQRFWSVDARAPQYAIIQEKELKNGVERQRYLAVDPQGTTRLLIDGVLPMRSILLTEKGDVAYTAGFEGPRYETVVRQHTGGGTRELLRCTAIEDCRLVGYNSAQQTLWLLSQHGEDKVALRRRRAQGRRWETVHRDPRGVADADDIVWNASREDWTAIAYHGGRREWYGNGGNTRAVLTALQQKLPDANVQLTATPDDGLWLVHAQQSDLALDHYYLYRPQLKRLQPLFNAESAANGGAPRGASMHPVTYRASDGMLLHGYVLLPTGLPLAKAPLIAWLHGGPITRVYDRYEGSMQLLVNRGYAVFVPNFRASAGYGLKYVLAAKGDVGNGRVLADIIDGMDFVLAEGIGDRSRQAVIGMSFGGYASLLALSHHPSRFRYAFAGAPPTEYGWIKQWQADHDSEALHAEGPPLSVQFPQLGCRYQDASWRRKMQRESPLAALGALKAPVYIWAGARDDHVPLKSIVNYVGEARRRGKPVSILIDPDGGHGPQTALGVEASLYMIELAAHKHFGGGLSPVSAELGNFLRRHLRQ